MAVIVSEGFNVVAPFEIDRRMIVDSVDTTPNSLINLEINYNYTNMIVWVRDEKAFYYLIDSPPSGGAVASDWTKLETGGGAGATACGKAGYVSGNSFVGSVPGPATASVTFETPYQSASYSVSITGLTNDNTSGYPDYIYSVIDLTPSGFTIQVNTSGPIGATAMWITNCWDGSGLFNIGGGFGGATVSIDLEEIAYGTGTGITSSSTFTFDVANTSLIFGNDHVITNAISSAIIAGTNSRIASTTKGYFIESNIILASTLACINCSDFSSIQNTNRGQIWNSTQSVVINSSSGIFGSRICNSNNAAIINAPRSCIINTPGSYENISRQFIIGGYLHTICQEEGPGAGNGYSGGSGIVGGAGNCICVGGVHSIILSGRCNLIRNLNFFDPTDSSPNQQKFSGGRSAILAGERNTLSGPKIDGSVIIGGCTNSITSGTIFSTIVGGCCNTIATSSNSAILGGQNNKICNSLRSNSIGGRCNKINDSSSSNNIGGYCNKIYFSNNSGIIGSYKSSMTASLSDEYLPISASKFNSILYSSCSSIIGNCFNSIISSSGSSILSAPAQGLPFQNPCHSLIIGGIGHEINGPKNSIILGGSNLKLCKSIQGGLGGFCDGFDNVVIAPSFIGRGSFALNIKTASNNISLDYEDFTLIAYPTISGMTVSLPPCEPGSVTDNMRGRIYVIKKDGSSTQSVVYISPYGNDTIDGYSDSIELINPWDYNILQSDGVNLWIKLGGAVGLNL